MDRRILIIGRYVSSYGGAHRYLENLVKILNEGGMRVLVVVEQHSDIVDFCKKLKDVGASLADVPFGNGQHEKNAGLLDEIINRFDPHLIDCEVAAKTIRHTLVRSECMRIRNVTKLFTMHLAIKSEDSPGSFFVTLNPLSSWHRELRKSRRFLNLFDAGLSVSEYHAMRIEKLMRLKKGFFRFIPNGVDLRKFSPAVENREEGIIIIGGCGNLVTQKRFDLLIKAAAIVEKEYENFLVRIAGDGPERKNLELLIQKYNLQDKIQFCGQQSDMAGFFQRLDLFVMCSDNEGFPYALLEAMSTGLPSVVTSVGDMPCMVEDKVNGFVVKKGDQAMLADALLRMIKRGKKGLTEYGLRARDVARKKYNKDNLDKQILGYYKALSEIYQGSRRHSQ